jgi:hypothetical protein
LPGGAAAASTKGRSGSGAPAPPDTTSSQSAVSIVWRVTDPATLSPYQCSSAPESGTRPRWVLRPTRPQHAAGIRIDPPPSVATPAPTMPAATAAPEPPLDPPGVRVVSHGFREIP